MGPKGVTYNFDSYVTASAPTLPPPPPKQINGGDKKYGPRKTSPILVALDTFCE